MNIAHTYLANALAAIEAADGLGVDHDCPDLIAHPMADGRILSTVASMRALGLITQAEHDDYAAACADRLSENSVELAGGLAWGLNFATPGSPADDPFIVTTAMIAEGLHETQPNAPLTEDATIALNNWPQGVDPVSGLTLPMYSPTRAEYYPNNVSMWAAVRIGLGTDPAEFTIPFGYVNGRYVTELGWIDGGKITLPHASQIVGSLRHANSQAVWEAQATEMLGAFCNHPDSYYTTLRVSDLYTIDTKAAYRIVDGQCLQLSKDPKHAHRAAGAALTIMADLTLHSAHCAFWKARLNRHLSINAQALPIPVDGSGNLYIRELAHFSYGITRALQALA